MSLSIWGLGRPLAPIGILLAPLSSIMVPRAVEGGRDRLSGVVLVTSKAEPLCSHSSRLSRCTVGTPCSHPRQVGACGQ